MGWSVYSLNVWFSYVIALFISFNNVFDEKAAIIPINTVPIVEYEIGCPYAVIFIGIVDKYFNIPRRSSFGIMLCKEKANFKSILEFSFLLIDIKKKSFVSCYSSNFFLLAIYCCLQNLLPHILRLKVEWWEEER